MTTVDVLIVGAGSAGATAAWKCCELGLSALLVEAKARERAGAWWLNGVETRLFEDLGLEAEAPVVFHTAPVFHLQSPGGQRVSCREVPTHEIHMGHLNEHLLRRAESAGAELWFETPLDSLVIANGVVRGARVRHDERLEAVRARVTVDATGFEGVVRSRLPRMLWAPEEIPDEDVCVAAQQIREIADSEGARAFLDERGLRSGELLSLTGRAGGYSILNIGVDLEAGVVTFLSGAMLPRGRQAAVELISGAIDELGFVGRKVSGGAGLVSVRRAFDQLVGEGYALLGTAASQVFPAHGSGVAAGMRAADILASVVGDALRRGSVCDTRTLWRYAADYQRGRGALCASNEAVRRLTESLSAADIDVLLGVGLINAAALTQSLGCLPLRLTLGQLFGAARGSLRAPRLVARVLATATRASAVQWHYERYPAEWDPEAFVKWRKRTARLFGGRATGEAVKVAG